MNRKYANNADAIELTGIKIVVPAKSGIVKINKNCKPIVKARGTGTSLISFTKYLYARAPNKAVKAESNAGLNTGLSKTGVNGASRATPNARMIDVTIVLVAIEIVEMISPSLLPCFTFARSRALTAHGTFKLTKFPVKKARYVPLVPRSGEYVITSIKPPTIKTKRGIKLFRITLKSGAVCKMIAIITGIKIIIIKAMLKNTRP